MIYLDAYGLPTEKFGDGGDSAMRAGVLCTFTETPIHIWQYEATAPLGAPTGLGVRHPFQKTWNNPWNFTRDQMMPLVAGLYFRGYEETVKRMLIATVKRCFFMQNFERDKPGSKKYPYPHKYFKDSNPTPETVTWGKELYEPKTPYRIVEKSFDFADPLMPHHVLHLSLCANHWSKYIFGILGYPCLLLACISSSLEQRAEQNQIQCMVKRAGKFWVWLYKKFDKNWEAQTRYYWDVRNENEYADMIIKNL